jgi:hypothetical protein
MMSNESDLKWAAFERDVFTTASVMRGLDVGSKMGAVHHLQSSLEYLMIALEREDEEP